MPVPWLLNQWVCSPWETEVDRQTAVDTEVVSTLPPPTSYDALPVTPDDNIHPIREVSTPEEWSFRNLTKNWPETGLAIPLEDQILRSDIDDVLEWANSHRTPEKAREVPQCFDYAHLQVSRAGYSVSGSASKTPNTMLVLHEYPDKNGTRTEVQIDAMFEAMSYLKNSLQAGTPILIGLRLNSYDPRPNELKSTPYIEPTNHFVVAVGMGTDDEGFYVSFFDYGRKHSNNDRLYLRSDLTMSSRGDHRHLTEVRTSTPY